MQTLGSGDSISDLLGYFRNTISKGAIAAGGGGNPSQDDASTATFRGLGNAGRAAAGMAMFKNGKLVRKPTLAIVGDKGPEVVVPLNKPKRARKLIKQAERYVSHGDGHRKITTPRNHRMKLKHG